MADAIQQQLEADLRKALQTMNSTVSNAGTAFNRIANSSKQASRNFNQINSVLSNFGQSTTQTYRMTYNAGRSFSDSASKLAGNLNNVADEIGNITIPTPGGTGGGGGGSGGGGGGADDDSSKDKSSMLKGLFGGLGSTALKLAKLGAGLTSVTTLFESGREFIMNAYNGWSNAISSSGALFGGDMTKYANMVADLRLTTAQFNAVLSRNSENFARFGGTVDAATERFARIGGLLRSTQVGEGTTSFVENLKMLGISAEESSELLGTYFSRLSMADRTRTMSDQELAEASAEYMGELTELAAVTGKSRKQAADDLVKLQRDASFRALASTFGDQAGNVEMAFKKLTDVVDPAGNAGFAEALEAAIRGDGVVKTDAGKAIQALMGDTINAMGADIRQTALAGGDANEAIARHYDEIQRRAAEITRDTTDLAMYDVGAIGEINLALRNLGVQNRANIDAAEKAGLEGISAYEALQRAIDKAAGNLEDEPTGGQRATNAIAEIETIIEDIKATGTKAAFTGLSNAADGLSGVVNGIRGALPSVGFDNAIRNADELHSTVPLINTIHDGVISLQNWAEGLFGSGDAADAIANATVDRYKAAGASGFISNKSTIDQIAEAARMPMDHSFRSSGKISDMTTNHMQTFLRSIAESPELALNKDYQDQLVLALTRGEDSQNVIKDTLEKSLMIDGQSLASLVRKYGERQSTDMDRQSNIIYEGNQRPTNLAASSTSITG